MYIVHVHQFLLQLKRLKEKKIKIIYKSRLANESCLFKTPYQHNIKSSVSFGQNTPNIARMKYNEMPVSQAYTYIIPYTKTS